MQGQVKWIAPNPCLMLSELDSILCTNFEFCKEKKLKNISKTYWSTKPSNLEWPKNSNKTRHILEDCANGVQVGDVDHVTL